MNVTLTFLILDGCAVSVALPLSWAGHRSDTKLLAAKATPMTPTRPAHDVDAVRTRFERLRRWPASGVTGERR